MVMPKFKLIQNQVDKLNLVSREILTGLSVIRAFGTQKYEEERFDDANKALTKTNLFVNRAMTFMMPLMMFVMNSIAVLIVWVGGHSINDGAMQVGDMMAFIQYTCLLYTSIGRAYKLGVNDYFSRPFDAAVVLRRVHNTIALHDKSMGNFQDTLGMLSDFYYVILKVNLTTDSYLILKDGFDDQKKYFDSLISFSARLRGFADMDCIYEDDKKEYLEFCNIKRLRKAFAGGNRKEMIRYRRKVKDEFKWVSLTMICSEEYEDDNQIVMLLSLIHI